MGQRRKAKRRIDYIGLGLIAVGLGCLQVMLDRGEDEDWFGSPFIRLDGGPRRLRHLRRESSG